MNWEEQLGIKASAFLAGVVGGLISLTYEDKVSPIKAITYIFSGGITAGYTFTAAEHYWQLHPAWTGVISFALGLTAMRLIGTLLNLVDEIRKDPSMLLSYSKLLKKLRNGSIISNDRNSGSSSPDLDTTRTNSSEYNK